MRWLVIAGSVLGMWPLADGLPSFEQRLAEARRVLREQLPICDPTEQRWAWMARDHYDASVTYEDLQRLVREVVTELPGDERRMYARVFRILENHFSFDYGVDVRRNFAELPWYAANHLNLKYETALQLGGRGLLQRVLAKRNTTAEPSQRECYESVRIAWEAGRGSSSVTRRRWRRRDGNRWPQCAIALRSIRRRHSGKRCS